MDADILGRLLAGSNPDVIEDGMGVKKTTQYPFSPADPQGDGSRMLDSMLSPQGIQSPLYNYTQDAQENVDQGSAMNSFANIPVMTSKMSLPPPEIEQAPIQPIQSLAPLKAKPQQIQLPEQDRSAEALIAAKGQMPLPEQTAPTQPDPLELLNQLQQERRDNQRMLAMTEAADRFGAALAGTGHLKYEGGKFDNLKNLADMPVQDYMTSDKFKKDNAKYAIDTEMSKLNLEKAKSQMNDEKAKNDPSSDISKVARASVLDSLHKIGRKDLAASITDKMSSKQIEDIFGQYNLTNMVTNFESQQNRLELDKIRAGEKAASNQEKMNEKDTRRLDQANKIVTASLARSNTAFGKTAGIYRAAEAIEQLVGNDLNLDNRQITELARNLDAMLSSGSPTIGGMKKLLPSTMSGDTAKIQEYLTGLPKGAGQQKFVKRMVETVEREKALAKKQMATESKKILSSYADLRKKQPEAWNTMIQAHGLPQDMFDGEEHDESPHPEFNVNQSALEAEMKRRGL